MVLNTSKGCYANNFELKFGQKINNTESGSIWGILIKMTSVLPSFLKSILQGMHDFSEQKKSKWIFEKNLSNHLRLGRETWRRFG